MSLGRVLVVDDEPQVVGVVREMLEHFGYEATVVSNADAAIVLMATFRPHVVLLDLQLGGMSGLEALRYLRQHHAVVPVIVITGNIEYEMARQARAVGAYDVIGKPFSLTALRSLLTRAMKLAPSR